MTKHSSSPDGAAPSPDGQNDEQTIMVSEELALPEAATPAAALLTDALRQAPPPLPQIPPASVEPSPNSNLDSNPGSNSYDTGQDTQGTGGPGSLPRVGTRINQYELIRQIGSGGMGSVFLARDTRLGRRVAIKFLHSTNPEVTQRFIMEARTTARCSHENIVVIYEVGEHRQTPFMVLEYLQGKTLSDLMERGKRMPMGRAIELMVPVVRALASAHEQGIVHRDLKPANILITDSGSIKVLDFGIAKVLQGDAASKDAQGTAPTPATAGAVGAVASILDTDVDSAELTRHGAIMGTLPFMSPEQWRNGANVDHRSDLWAAGIILFRLLSGKHPLDPLKGEQLYVTGILNEPMPSLRTAASDLPNGLIEVVDKCLVKKRDGRMPDALSLLRALEPFLPGRYSQNQELRVDESPYAGLSSFQENDAHRFFGRTREIAALANRIADRPLIGVVGTSGAGKSSFVRAGLVPALKRSGENWESIVIRPGRSPLSALADSIAPMISTSNSVADDLDAQRALAGKLRNEPGYVGSVLRSRARREKKKILVFVDQFEELYTLVPDAKERLAFTACLAGIADDATAATRVVLSIRSDFLDRVPEDQAFMAELSQGLFFLTAPDRDGLRDAIVQPAEMAGYRFESPEIVDDMLQHLATTPGALPLLQFAATQLWESRDPARKLLTRASYDALGGIAGALANHADRVVSELAPQARALARAVMLRLVTPERTRAIVSIDEIRELSRDKKEIQRLVDQLVQARLLVVQTGGASGGTVEIVHESLIHSWPTLRRWLDESGEDAAFIEQLRNAARQWNAKGRDSNLLWRGDVVEEARRFQRRYRGELPEVQKAFLDAIVAEQARSARRKQALIVGAGIFFALLFVAASVALVVIRRSQREAEVQAIAARNAETVARGAEAQARAAEVEARKRLEEVQQKERERAEAAKRLEEASKQLQQKNTALVDALERAERERLRARFAQKHSEQSAWAAKLAREDALKAAKELQELLAREQDRVQRLQDQLGSPVIEELK